jgi:hypothetical protein
MKELVALVASYALAWRASRLAPMGGAASDIGRKNSAIA